MYKTSDYIQTQGTVTATEIRDMSNDRNPSSNAYYAHIKFKDQDGNYHETEKQYLLYHSKENDTVKIYYDPSDPDKIRPQMLPYYAALAVIIVIILLFIFALFKGRILDNYPAH